MRHQCPRCAGRRHITVMEPNVRKYGGVTYHSSLPAPYLPKNHTCHVCKGRGTVDCLVCLDEGEIADLDKYGNPVIYPCGCLYGRMIAEAQAAEAERAWADAATAETAQRVARAAHEAALPDHDAIAHQRIANGLPPF